jgi:hypothetical protein
MLHFYRLDTGERLLTPNEPAEELSERAVQSSVRAAREVQARQAAEQELARLRVELNRRNDA